MLTKYFSDDFIIGSTACNPDLMVIEAIECSDEINDHVTLYVLCSNIDGIIFAESMNEKELKDYAKKLIKQILIEMFEL